MINKSDENYQKMERLLHARTMMAEHVAFYKSRFDSTTKHLADLDQEIHEHRTLGETADAS